jgi:hypothetical protein
MKRTFVTLLTLGFSLSALAQSSTLKPKRMAGSKRPAARKVASVDGSAKYLDVKVTEGAAKRGRSDLGLEVSFLTGLAQTADASTSQSSIYLGVQGDLHWGRFLGAEIDAYYNPGIGSGGASASQYGGLVSAKGRYGFRLGKGAIVTPKLGAGFGAQGITSSVQSGSLSSSATMEAAGLFGAGGVEARLFHRFTLDIDYARMLAGTASATNTLLATMPAATSGGFDRFRIGAYYRISVPLSLGAQFIRRTITVQSASGAETTTGMNQFLGVVTVHW